ncbi:MAG: threonine synthase [Treponema sp.]|jgi:threonine synthase|nr:threonine synthase [Treponema sp.]
MKFCSTRYNTAGIAGAAGSFKEVSFMDAALRCLPPEGGLYVPSSVPDLRQFFLHMDEKTSYPELVAALAPALLEGELNPLSASRIAESAFHFEPELITLDDNFSVLALYNGPTGVFKDFGYAFLAAMLEELQKNNGQAMIISAVRTITGASIARTFQGRKGLTAVLLYPSGPIMGLDQSSFVPNGGNIIPVQIRGNYSDCQRLVNEIINDRPFAERHRITSADTINPGRLLPQAFYYLYAFVKVKTKLSGELVFSVPSGNFGNFISGLYAWKFGMPVNSFIAAMNANDAFGSFIRGGKFEPQPQVSTCSPALDIAQPANYERLESFYMEAPAVMKNMVYPSSVSDHATLDALEYVWKHYKLLLDPHSAVAFAAAQNFHRDAGDGCAHTIILATGHPAGEANIVKQATGQSIQLPEKLKELSLKSEPIALIDPQLDALESAIASCF